MKHLELGGQRLTAEIALRLRSVWVSKMYAFPLKNEASGDWAASDIRVISAGIGLRLRSLWVSKMYAFPLEDEASEAWRRGDHSRNCP